MRIKNLAVSTAILAAMAGINSAQADFTVSLKTTTNDGVDTAANRLFKDDATTLSPAGTPVWLVIDVDLDGTVFNTGPLVGVTPGAAYPVFDGTASGLASLLFDSGDLWYQTTVPGPLAGRINSAITLPEEAQTGGNVGTQIGGTVKPAYAIVFDDANFTDGFCIGVNGALTPSGTIPTLGNVVLRIGENTAANQYCCIPEPSTAAIVGLCLTAVALLRRRAMPTTGTHLQARENYEVGGGIRADRQ